MTQKSSTLYKIVIGAIIVSIVLIIGVRSQKFSVHSQKARTPQESAEGGTTESANTGLQERLLTIGDAKLLVEIAQTPKEQMIGLSYRKSLAEGRGMLFIFDRNDTHSIWMKDMHFPIDIVWITEAMKVAHIAQNVSPDTFPQVFSPPSPARYVLETPAGYTKGKIQPGDTMTLTEL